MATLYSNHYNSSGTVGPGEGALTEELGLDSTKKVSAGLSHSRLRRSHAKCTVGTVAGASDEIRMLTLKSSDRLHSLLWSTDGGSTNGTADLGWYKSGAAHNGALPSTNSVDAFSTTAFDIKTAAGRTEAFELGDLDTEDIGKQVWELINVSDASTYTVDPGGTFDITWTVVEAVSVAVVTVQLEAYYTSGD